MVFTVRSVSQIFWQEDLKMYEPVLSKYGEYIEENNGYKYYKIIIPSLDELSVLGKEIYESRIHGYGATLDINFVDMEIEIVDDYRD